MNEAKGEMFTLTDFAALARDCTSLGVFDFDTERASSLLSKPEELQTYDRGAEILSLLELLTISTEVRFVLNVNMRIT